MTLSVTPKTITIGPNGVANDAGPVDTSFSTVFANTQTIASYINANMFLIGSANSVSGANTFSAKQTFSATVNLSDSSEPGSPIPGDYWYSATNSGFEGLVQMASVSTATNASPIVVTTTSANTLQTGDTVYISGVSGNTAANGSFVITVSDTTHFSLNGSTGSGAYAGGGTVGIVQTVITNRTSPTLYSYLGFSADTTVTVAQKGTMFDFTGSTARTLTFPASSSLKIGWYCFIRNSSTAVLTIAPNGVETVDATKVYPGENITITTDGSNLKMFGRKLGWINLSRTSVSGSPATIAMPTQFFTSDFDEVRFKCMYLAPASGTPDLWGRISQDGGSTYSSGGSDYTYNAGYWNTSSTWGSQAAGTDSKTIVSRSVAQANPIITGRGLSISGNTKMFELSGSCIQSGSVYDAIVGYGTFLTNTNAINGYRLEWSGGQNFANQGYIVMEGFRSQ